MHPREPPAGRGIRAPGRPARDDHPSRRALDSLGFFPTEGSGGAPDRSTQARGGANGPRTMPGLGRKPIQTLKRTEPASLDEPRWTPLPNVLRLSCGANRRSE